MALTRRLAPLALAVLLALPPAPASAGAGCFARAARLAGVSSDLLLAMSFVESRWKPSVVNRGNADGSEDVCLMQINSAHYRRLAEIGVSRDRLLSDWCVCLLAGAEILREMRDAVGTDDIWAAVAAYNAGPDNIPAGRAYAARVRRVLDAFAAARANRAGADAADPEAALDGLARSLGEAAGGAGL